jgi:hypothetical protein
MVRAVGVDPHWALTGEFDAAVHRDAMLLAEDRSTAGDHALREFVSVQFRELRRDSRSPKERSE